MSQHELRAFEFKKGVKMVQRIECDWVEVRRTGNELAEEIGDVSLHAYNEPLRRWEKLGVFHGKMRYTNAWGEHCVIRPDFTGLDFVKKDGSHEQD